MMSEQQTHHAYKKYIIVLFLLSFLLLLFVAYHSIVVGSIGFIAYTFLAFYFFKKEQQYKEEIQQYILSLASRLQKVDTDLTKKLPIGILLYNEDHQIAWNNPYLLELLQKEEALVGHALKEIIPRLEQLNENMKDEMIRYNQKFFRMIHQPEEKMIYLFDHTDYYQLQHKYRINQVAMIQIHLDNLNEVTQGLDEQSRSLLVSEVSRAINQWTLNAGIFLKRLSSDKFFGMMTEQTLRKLEENRFEILDTIRALTSKNRIPVTLSIGIAISTGEETLQELGQLSQSSLDIALGRGGDQAAVKRGAEKITFYGGKSNAVEKRTRVRARVISHALRNLIKESDQIFVMGHKDPDMDSIGAAIGILKAVQVNERKGYIVIDRDQNMQGISKLLEEIEEDKELKKHFISPYEALELKTGRSLLIIVDAHKPDMLIYPPLLNNIAKRVVIDHHRRGEEFIADPLLVYMEPYASSTSELVTELLEYQSNHIHMSILEATAMLAGIVVDTKSFSLRTGSRTFEAASYLRHNGADTTLVQKLLKEDKEQLVKRAKLVASSQIYKEHIAIAAGAEGEYYSQISIAQAADTLLSMNGVEASFVLTKRKEGGIAISARSLGEINVQVVMEKMNGGGHLTHAATQIEEDVMQNATEWLQEIIDDYLEGGQ